MSVTSHQIEYIPRTECPLHEVPKSIPLREEHIVASVTDPVTSRTFRILRCPACGAGLTDPYPSQETVKYLYEGRTSVSNFDPIRGTVMDKIKDAFARRDIRHLHAIAGKPPIRSVLDFGAGYGRFAIASKTCFPQATVDAVDFDLAPPPTLERCATGMRYLPLEAFLKSTEKYDLIILRAVIEHVHDPKALLRTLMSRMTENGILYVEAPNLDSALIYYFGCRINTYGVPYHLFNFSVASLKAIINDAGLEGEVFFQRLPMAGCVLAGLLKQERNVFHQFAGIILHPAQWLVELVKGRYILAAICRFPVGR